MLLPHYFLELTTEQLLPSEGRSCSLFFTPSYRIYTVSMTFAWHKEVACKEILVNWLKVVHSPSSKHLKANTMKSVGTGDCS